MIPDHERIDELLAGHVLRGLSDADRVEADRLLAEHVPACVTCQRTLAGFQAVVGDLALAAAPVTPPETLLPRLHRELEPEDRRRRPAQLFAVAAGVVVVVGLAGLAVTQDMRASHSRARAALIVEAMNIASAPNASIKQVGPTREIASPGSQVVYLFGSGVPTPPAGQEYRVWLLAADGSATFMGALTVEDGIAFAKLFFDPSTASEILITVEPTDSIPGRPGRARWRSAA